MGCASSSVNENQTPTSFEKPSQRSRISEEPTRTTDAPSPATTSPTTAIEKIDFTNSASEEMAHIDDEQVDLDSEMLQTRTPALSDAMDVDPNGPMTETLLQQAGLDPVLASIARELREAPFFKPHSWRQILGIVSNMEEVPYTSGTVICQQNAEQDAFYVLRSMHDADAFSIDSDQAQHIPRMFGETCLRYNDVKWAMTLIAQRDITVFRITPQVYRRLIVREAKQEENHLLGFLRKVPLLKHLTEEQLVGLSKAVQHAHYPDGEKIIAQGTMGSSFYLIESGTVKCLQHTRKGPREVTTEVNRYSAGDYFGEGALLKDAPRNADVVAIGDVTCLVLKREDFTDLLGSLQLLMERNFRARVLKGVEILSKLTDSERAALAELLDEEIFEPGQRIIRQGDFGDRFYIIKDGEVCFRRIPDGRNSSAASPSGSSNSGMSVIPPPPPPPPAVPASFQDGPFHESTPDPAVAAAAAAAVAAAAAMSSASVNGFPPQASVPPPPPHIPGGSTPPMPLSLPVSGSPSPSPVPSPGQQQFAIAEPKEEEIGRLFSGAYFGEGALLTAAPRRASAYAVGHVTLLSLERSQFDEIFDESLQDLLNRDFEKRKTEDTDTNVEFSDLEQLSVLGAGSYGQVLLVNNKVTGRTYALKTMAKARIVQMGQQSHVLNEKHILESTNHPFIVSLKQSYVSPDHVFVLLEAVLGGELFAYMRCAGRLRLKDATFYIAQVILVFEYLHSKNIIYRDLKPENLLVAANGYLKFTDFGLAKVLINDRKTYTLCGTPAYASPEVYSLAGHGKPADWWTLGVLTHEMLSATTPFDGNAEQIFASLEEYSRAYPNIRLPRGLSGDSADFTLRLLNPNPTKRLGCLPRGNGARDVKLHPLFRNCNFSRLLRLETKPPFEPKIDSTFDTNNFYTPALKGKPIKLDNVDPKSIRIGEWEF
eukprot:CAMPEP_0171559988 /NCGR_PEP_ID=MMETSP0960-20121227/13251_1 /TAXON_ID=87120 /ORGANISM="Aurantiochytrium limacinum, Strain ATCCMYA-1381" /LENGTH=935 /DNA_ID=CAMNT_0012111747 /DNA_START=417 /DNA_END=3224 /DNA_ORIENTATION=-